MTYPIGSPQADKAYERQRDVEADRYWQPKFTCPWCGCMQNDEETCTECGETLICPSCGDTDLQWGHTRAEMSGSVGCDTDYRQCNQCSHTWDFQ